MECIPQKNKIHCNCTFEPCPRKYKCCEYLHYHRQNDEIPACYFTKGFERTYDRSINNYFKMKGGV